MKDIVKKELLVSYRLPTGDENLLSILKGSAAMLAFLDIGNDGWYVATSTKSAI